MKIIVTGAAGFIGSVTVDLLRENGHEVIGIDNFSTGFYRDTVEINHNLCHWSPDLATDARLHDSEAIIHLAAHTLVGESTAVPMRYLDGNTQMLMRAIKLADALQVQRFVFASSANVYSDSPYGNTPYGLSKTWGEQCLEWAWKACGLRSVIFRYFNVAGGTGKRQTQYEPETHLVPLAFRAARGGQTLKLFGSDYETRDGTAERDYIHVWDVARANMMR